MRSKRRKELACPERGFEPSAPSGRCSEGRIGRNREYCKRQRCKTTIFQPAFVAVSATSRRRGCIGAVVIYVNPSVNPPCGVLPAPRPGSLLEYYTNFNIKPALKGEVGFAKQKPEGLHRGCSCLRQPLSQTAARRISHGAAIFHIAQAVIVCQTGDIQLMPNVN